MSSEMDSANQSIYLSQTGVEHYKVTHLQAPEISIFVKYRDAFYGKHILDIGCGAGRTSFHLRNFSEHYIGVDYSAEMIAYSRKAYPELEFHERDARDLSRFSPAQFDFILFSYNGIDYVTHQDRLIVFAEIKRLLKKDGLFVFSTHNRNFKNISTTPRFEFKLNPLRLPGEMADYLTRRSNRSRLSQQEVNEKDYAIINDSGNNFGLLTYYISRQAQIEQLQQAGFEVIDTYGLNGRQLKTADDDSGSCWIYYVTRL